MLLCRYENQACFGVEGDPTLRYVRSIVTGSHHQVNQESKTGAPAQFEQQELVWIQVKLAWDKECSNTYSVRDVSILEAWGASIDPVYAELYFPC